MHTTLLSVTLAAVLSLGGAASAVAAPLDQLKDLKLDAKGIARPQQAGIEFTFSGFKVRAEPDKPVRTWVVDLKISAAIERGYLVRTTFQGRGGETLFSGEDIELPAGRAGKTFHLTHRFQKEPVAAAIVFEVVNRADQRSVATQSYPLGSVASRDLQGATTATSPAAPQRVPGHGDQPVGGIAYALTLNDAEGKVQIQNKSSFPLRLDGVTAQARFQVGVNEEIAVNCNGREIQPGKTIACDYQNTAASCATLAGIDFNFRLNGTPYRESLPLETSPIRKIVNQPIVIRLAKNKPTGSRVDMKGSGSAEVTIRGSYVKPGAGLTLKAVASVDSDMFPVVFSGEQRDDGIHASVEVVGARDGAAPDKFCFRLLEITTDDSCGGVGALLYRNPFDKYDFKHQPAGGPAYYFLNNVHCK